MGIIALGLITIVATGGDGGGNHSTGTAPEILGVDLYDSNWDKCQVFDIGDYVNFKIHAKDPDKDMEKVYITQYHPSDSSTPYYGPDVIDLPSTSKIEEVFYNLTPILVDGPSGGWRIEFQIEDSQGNESNIWIIYGYIN